MRGRGSAGRRAAAAASLCALAACAALLATAIVVSFPYGIISAALLLLSAVVALFGVMSTGPARVVAWSVGAATASASVLVHVRFQNSNADLAALAFLVLAIPLTRRALAVRVLLPPVEPPRHPVLFWNPASGGGKAAQVGLADEARKRGIEPIEMEADGDLAALVRTAVAAGADGLMAAGGDGTQATIARIAAEHGLPFACIPSGTRNHFALDLGVDRDDVVGALDAFVDGGEKRVDLAVIGERVFVNNASLGVYALAVRKPRYRQAKFRTLLEVAPGVMSGESETVEELHWLGPDGSEQEAPAVILVSNNPYRLGIRLGTGTRPRMDAGALGIQVAGARTKRSGWTLREGWSATEFTVDGPPMIHVGVDGEAMTVPSPVTFRIRPGALRVRVARGHPAASPSAGLPDQPTGLVPLLLRVATGRGPFDD